MQEGRSQEVAYLGKIHALQEAGSGVRIEVVGHPGRLPLVNDTIWRIRDRLDIAQYEFNRNHWAVKDRDLLSILEGAEVPVNAGFTGEFGNLPLPAPSRRQLLDARDAIAKLSHTELDDILLEAGVDGLDAGRAVGSRRDRANAIAQFIIENPGAVTAENAMLAAFFMRKTVVPADPIDEKKQLSGAHEVMGPRETPIELATSPRRVFVVHGHDSEVSGEVASYLGAIGLEAIVLHEQPNMGRHLLTKFINEADSAAFAVVLMTADDYGGVVGGPQRSRARQNVILELGYFLSHLGQARVCALITPDLETPSDFDGIVYIPLDEEQSWKLDLLRELEAAQLPVVQIGGSCTPGPDRLDVLKTDVEEIARRLRVTSLHLELDVIRFADRGTGERRFTEAEETAFDYIGAAHRIRFTSSSVDSIEEAYPPLARALEALGAVTKSELGWAESEASILERMNNGSLVAQFATLTGVSKVAFILTFVQAALIPMYCRNLDPNKRKGHDRTAARRFLVVDRLRSSFARPYGHSQHLMWERDALRYCEFRWVTVFADFCAYSLEGNLFIERVGADWRLKVREIASKIEHLDEAEPWHGFRRRELECSGNVAAASGDYETARTLFREAVELGRTEEEGGDPVVTLTNNLCQLLCAVENVGDRQALIEEIGHRASTAPPTGFWEPVFKTATAERFVPWSEVFGQPPGA